MVIKAFQRYVDRKLDRARPIETDSDVEDDRARAIRRIEQLQPSELPKWFDQCMYEVGRWTTEYKHDPDPVYLDEMRFGLQCAELVLDRMQMQS